MEIDECNSGTDPTNTNIPLLITITTHHSHIITAKSF